MQNKQTKTNNSKVVAQNKGDKTMKANKQTQETKQQARLEDKVLEMLAEAQKADKNIKVQKVTGYTSVKYGNKVLFEFHNKKKSISHLTFSNKQKAYEILNKNKLVHRIVPASYGWKYNTECHLNADFMKFFPAILKSVIAEAVEERNLKAKTTDKKVAKKA